MQIFLSLKAYFNFWDFLSYFNLSKVLDIFFKIDFVNELKKYREK